MALVDPFVSVVRVTEGALLGDAMSKIHAWLDGQNIQPAAFTAATNAKGYTLTLGFRTIEEASRFRLQFAANRLVSANSDSAASTGLPPVSSPSPNRTVTGRRGGSPSRRPAQPAVLFRRRRRRIP